MNYIKEKLNNIYIPLDSGKIGLFFSILAIAFVVSSSNTPCLQAQSTCAIGSDNEFTGNISLKGGTANKGTFDASGLTSDRTWTLPDATGTLAVVGATLPASKVMATDVSGNESTTDVYPLSLTSSSPLKTDALGNVTASDLDPETDLTVGTGIPSQVLSVNSGGTALEFTSITGVPSLTASKSVATDGTGALTTTDVYPLTLTASTPLKTDALGNVTASDLDITTDITPGTSLQEIRVNSGGTALEYFTPTSGSPVTLLDSGSVTANGDEFLICWYGTTFDPDKKYKLVLWGGDGNIGTIGYQANLKLSNNDCISSTRTEFTADISTTGRWLGSGTANNPYTASSGVWAYSQSGFRNVGQCYPLTGTTYSTFYRPANIGGEFTFQAAGGFTSTTGDRGALMQFDMYADTFDYSQTYFMGVNTGEGFCSWQNTTNMFADITGMYGQLEGGSSHPVTNKKWSLYEVASQ